MKKLLIPLFLFISTPCLSADDVQSRAKNVFDSIKGRFSNKESLENNFLAPLTKEDAPMTTLKGDKQFAAQVGCNSYNEYLTVGASINANGSVNVSTIIDSNLNGTVDQETNFNGIDIVCSNGYKQCDSSIDDCDSYRWQSNPSISSKLIVSESETQLFGCFCVNNQCGENLANRNYDEVIRSLGNGIASVMQQHNPYYTISDVKLNSTTLNYFGHKLASCKEASVPQLQNYKNQPKQLLVKGEEAKDSEQYAMIKNVSQRQGVDATEQSCSITREFEQTPVQVGDILKLVGGEGRIESCGINCVDLVVGEDKSNVINLSDKCHLKTYSTQLKIMHPDKVVSATIIDSSFEELMRVESNLGLLATYDDYAGDHNCHGHGNHRVSYPGTIDVTEHFKQFGMINLTTDLAIKNAGNFYYRIRFKLDAKQSFNAKFSFYSQGQNYIQCEFSLASGYVSCDTDGNNHNYQLSKTVDIDDFCNDATQVIMSEVGNPNPTGSTGKHDTSVINSVIQKPTCDNNLTGIVRVEDKNKSSGYEYFLSNAYDFNISKPVCDLDESLINTCTEYENECTLKHESIDGVVTVNNLADTGLTPLIQKKWINHSSCKTSVTREFYQINRTYLCPNNSKSYDIDISHFVKPEITDSEIEIRLNNSNEDSQVTMPIPSLPESEECTKTCEVKRLVDDTRVNQSGLVSENRTDKSRYETSVRSCEENTCPLSGDEEMTRGCGCSSSFSKAMSMMQLMRLAGKDMVCTDGE